MRLLKDTAKVNTNVCKYNYVNATCFLLNRYRAQLKICVNAFPTPPLFNIQALKYAQSKAL